MLRAAWLLSLLGALACAPSRIATPEDASAAAPALEPSEHATDSAKALRIDSGARGHTTCGVDRELEREPDGSEVSVRYSFELSP